MQNIEYFNMSDKILCLNFSVTFYVHDFKYQVLAEDFVVR